MYRCLKCRSMGILNSFGRIYFVPGLATEVNGLSVAGWLNGQQGRSLVRSSARFQPFSERAKPQKTDGNGVKKGSVLHVVV